MTVLDEFYLLFKSNTKETQADVKALDKEIADLAAKGSKRDETEFKRLKELRKRRQEAVQDLKDQGKVADETGAAFEKLVESATEFGAAIFSFAAIKTGILDAASFNRQLGIQGRLWGDNAKDIKTWSFAVQQAGGTIGGLQSAIQSAFSATSAAGLPFAGTDKYLRNVHNYLKGLSVGNQAAYLASLGIADPGLQRLLESSDEEFERRITEASKVTEITKEGTQAADEFGTAWSKAAQKVDAAFSKMGTVVLPFFTDLLNKFTNASTLGLLWAAVTPADTIGSSLGGTIAGKIKKSPPRGPRSEFVNKDAMSFYISQGYSRDQAAGIVANEQAESGGDPRARNGSHVGLYQWEPSRAAAILTGTGIDVRTASAEDQRAALVWELKNRGWDAGLKNTVGPNAAAAFFSNNVEFPSLDPQVRATEAVRRGQVALNIANTSPFNSAGNSFTGGNNTSTSVKIDNVNVHTQATDASGISSAIGQELNAQIRASMSNIDDGVQY